MTARAFRLVAVLAAGCLTASTFAKALLDVSTTWDVWYYHLPFAARFFGIVPREAYAFHALNEARYEGFPLLAELLQGLFWVIFRRPEAANLVALLSVGVLVAFLRRVFAVPLHLAVLALLAVPLVQAHATACYIDLPANVAAAILVLSAYEAFVHEGPVPSRLLARAALAAAVAANMRLQLNPLVAVVLAVLAARVVVPLVRDRTQVARRRAARTLGVALVVLPVVFASPLKNLVRHGNPVYPMKMTVLGVTLEGPEDVYSDAPPYLAHSPRAVRFAYSALEIGVRPIDDPARWSVDQWMPPASTGNRMGGFFGAYVVLHLTLFVWGAFRERTRATRVAAVTFGALTLFVANAPQSHELRYYMFWMLVLVALNLVATSRRGGLAPHALGAVCLAAVVVVALVTRGVYIFPIRYGFGDLVRDKVSADTLAKIEQLPRGERACLVKEPWTILYASPFHPLASYAVREAETPDGCAGDTFVP